MTNALWEWDKYLDLLKGCADLPRLTWQPESEQMRAEVYRQLLMNASLGYFMFFQSDPEHPEWSPFLNSVFLLQPNPDDVYYVAYIRSDRTYRIAGTRGSVHKLTFTLGADNMAMSERKPRNFGEYDADSLQMDSGGTFEILLSRERPQGHSGNWLRLDSETDWVTVRLRSYDWGNEVDPRFIIECLDPVSLKPRPSPSEIHTRMVGMLGFMERLTHLWIDFLNDLRARGLVNRLELTGFEDMGGVKVQKYWRGIFEFSAGEAVILETELPEKRVYWNIQLADWLFNQLELVYRQTSLNGHQAMVDSDGRFRAVLSLEDPGVPNWLDTAGYTVGSLVGRWYECSSAPMPTMKRVPLAEVRKHLPPDTPVVSAQERQAALRARVAGAQLRRKW